MKVRYGIIGAGNISKKFAEAVNLSENATLEMVSARGLEKAKTFAEEFDIPNYVNSYDELLQNENVDAVYIALINCLHSEWIEKAILAGKAVICEKPMVTDKKTAEKLTALAKEHNVLLMEAMWTRFLPPMKKAKEWIKSDKIGEVSSMDIEFSYRGNKNGKAFTDKSMQAGIVYGVGVYCIECAMDLAESKAKQIQSMCHYSDEGVDIEDFNLIRFENGIIARLTYAIAGKRENNATVYGTDGHILIDTFYDTKKATLFDKQGNVVEVFENNVQNGFIYEVEHFSDLYLTGKKQSDIMPLSETIECTRIFEEVIA